MLQGKVAVVTGGGRGIGAATAEALAAAGAQVAIVARSAEQLNSTAARIHAAGGHCVALVCDIGQPAAIQEAHAEVLRVLGPVDVLINNAGVVWPLGPTVSVPLDEWSAALAINLTGSFAWIQAVLPSMLERRWGRVINISSGVAVGIGMIPANAYSVGKAGLEMLTRNLAAELEGTGVCVHAVQPGIVESEMQKYIRDQPPEHIGETLPARHQRMKDEGRLLDATAPATLIVHLLAEETTGEVISIYDERGKALRERG